MAEYSQNEFLQRINYYFPDNSSQQISPKDIRDAFTDLVDSHYKFLESSIIVTRNLKSVDLRQTSAGELALDKTYLVYESGADNSAFGYSALNGNIYGQKNTAVGSYSISCNLDGDCNVGVGFGSLMGGVEGDGNVAIGVNSLYHNRRGSYNIGIGLGAGYYIGENDSYQFFLGAHPDACDSECLEGSGSPLLRGDLEELKLAVGTNEIHNYGTLQVSGDVSPTEHRGSSLGNTNRAWSSVNDVLLFPDSAKIQSTVNIFPHVHGLDFGSYDLRWDGFFKSIQVGETLAVSGDSVFHSNVDIDHVLEVFDNAFFHSGVDIDETLEVSGDTVVYSNLSVGQKLEVSGDSILHSNLDIGESLEVSGDAAFHKNVSISGTVEVSGYAVFHSGVDIGHTLQVSGDSFFHNNVDIKETLEVSGDAFFHSSVDIGETLEVSGDAVLHSNLDVGETLEVSGDAFFYSNVDIEQTLEVTGDAFFYSNVDIEQTLEVTGDAFFRSNVDIDETLEVTGVGLFHSGVDVEYQLKVYDQSFLYSHAYVGRHLTVENNAYIRDNLFVADDAFVTGNLHVGQTLHSTGNAYFHANAYVEQVLEVTGDAFFHSNVDINQTLEVTGEAFFRSNVFIDDELAVTGDAYFHSGVDIDDELAVTGNTYLHNNLYVNRDVEVTGDAFFHGRALVDDFLEVTGDAAFHSNVDIKDTLEVSGDAFFHDNVDIKNTLEVSGDSFFYKDVYISGTLEVSGDATFHKNMDVSGTLEVSGDATFHSDVDVSGTLEVSGDASFHRNVAVSGTLEASGNAAFHSDVQISGALEASGDAAFHSDVDISGTLAVSGQSFFHCDVTAAKTIEVSGRAFLKESVEIDETLTVTGDATFGRDVSIGRSIKLRDKPIYVEGFFRETISPPDDFCAPTSGLFLQKIFNGSACDDGEFYYVVNRDRDLTINAGSYGQVLQYENEYRPIWISCNTVDPIIESCSLSPYVGYADNLNRVVTNVLNSGIKNVLISSVNGDSSSPDLDFYNIITRATNRTRYAGFYCREDGSSCGFQVLSDDDCINEDFCFVEQPANPGGGCGCIPGIIGPEIMPCAWGNSFMGIETDDQTIVGNSNFGSITSGDFVCFVEECLVPTWPENAENGELDFASGVLVLGYHNSCGSMTELRNMFNNTRFLQAVMDFQERNGVVWIRGNHMEPYQNGYCSDTTNLNQILEILNVQSRFGTQSGIKITQESSSQHPDDYFGNRIQKYNEGGSNKICVPESYKFYGTHDGGLATSKGDSIDYLVTYDDVNTRGNFVNPILFASGESYPGGPRLIGQNYSDTVFTMVHEAGIISGIQLGLTSTSCPIELTEPLCSGLDVVKEQTFTYDNSVWIAGTASYFYSNPRSETTSANCECTTVLGQDDLDSIYKEEVGATPDEGDTIFTVQSCCGCIPGEPGDVISKTITRRC